MEPREVTEIQKKQEELIAQLNEVSSIEFELMCKGFERFVDQKLEEMSSQKKKALKSRNRAKKKAQRHETELMQSKDKKSNILKAFAKREEWRKTNDLLVAQKELRRAFERKVEAFWVCFGFIMVAATLYFLNLGWNLLSWESFIAIVICGVGVALFLFGFFCYILFTFEHSEPEIFGSLTFTAIALGFLITALGYTVDSYFITGDWAFFETVDSYLSGERPYVKDCVGDFLADCRE